MKSFKVPIDSLLDLLFGCVTGRKTKKEYYKSGRLRGKKNYNYKNGKQEGSVKEYYENGSQWVEGEIVD